MISSVAEALLLKIINFNMWKETYKRLLAGLRELTGIFFKYKFMFSFCQSDCKRGESFPLSWFGRKCEWSCLERNGD